MNIHATKTALCSINWCAHCKRKTLLQYVKHIAPRNKEQKIVRRKRRREDNAHRL